MGGWGVQGEWVVWSVVTAITEKTVLLLCCCDQHHPCHHHRQQQNTVKNALPPAHITTSTHCHHHALPRQLGSQVRLGRLLLGVARQDHPGLSRMLSRARDDIMRALVASSMESYSRAYPQLAKLHMLQEIADVAAIQHTNGRNKGDQLRRLQWGDRLKSTQPSLAVQVARVYNGCCCSSCCSCCWSSRCAVDVLCNGIVENKACHWCQQLCVQTVCFSLTCVLHT